MITYVVLTMKSYYDLNTLVLGQVYKTDRN